MVTIENGSKYVKKYLLNPNRQKPLPSYTRQEPKDVYRGDIDLEGLLLKELC